MRGGFTLALFRVPISASVASPSASNLVEREHLAAKTLAIFPLYLGGACPIKLAWYIKPYFGVSCLVFSALKRAFSAPRICTVLAGCFAKLTREPANPVYQLDS